MTQPLSFPTTQQRSLDAAATALTRDGKPKLDWKPVDIDSLPPDIAALYDSFRRAQAIAFQHCQAFEDAICGPLAKMLKAKPGQDVLFGYKFGKLSVALGDKPSTKPSNALRF